MTVTSTAAKYPFFQRSVYTDSRYPGQILNYYSGADMRSFGSSFNTVDRNSNSKWKKLVASGTDATNYYKRVGQTCDPAFAYAQTAYTTASYKEVATNTLIWLGSTPGFFSDKTDSALYDLAVTRLKRKLSASYGAMNAAVPTAELKELRSTIRAATGLTVGVVDKLMAITARKGKNLHRIASDVWLSYNFGIAPVLKTIDDVSDSIAAYYKRTDRVVRVTGIASKSWRSGTWYGSHTGTKHAVVDEQVMTLKRLSYKVIASFSLPLASSNNYGLDEHLGFKLPSVLPAIWELTAYSWIIDYFSTVGAYFDDIVTSPPGTSRYIVLCRRFTADSDVRLNHRITTAGARFVSQESIPGWQKYYEFERQALQALPRAALRFRSLDEVGLHGVNKLLNLVAVAVNTLGRARR